MLWEYVRYDLDVLYIKKIFSLNQMELKKFANVEDQNMINL